MIRIGKCQICDGFFRWNPMMNAYSCHPQYGVWCETCQQAADRSMDHPTAEEQAERAKRRAAVFG